MSSTVETATEIRPFHVEIPDEQIDDLHRRIAATRLPSKELVGDASQGVQLATLQELARYWVTDHDWRKVEAKLNALPQFKTEIDGLDVHFIHVKSPHEHALPLIITHGWPGSVIELLEVVGPLTDPTAHGGEAEDAFDLVLPSLPGYGFSGQPTELGWDPGRVARAWAELMNRLGYTRYVAQGGDIGANVTDALGRLAPDGPLGIHLNFLSAFPTEVGAALFGGLIPAGLFKRVAIAILVNRAEKKEPVALDALAALFRRGYFVEMPEHPQTIGYALTDTPVGLAAWMLDHDADSYEKISHAFLDGQPVGGLTRDRIVDNITLYWLTNTADLVGAALLGELPNHLRRDRIRGEIPRTLSSGGLHRLPRRDLQSTAQLGREGLPEPHLLQRGRQGRALRGVGGARALRRGDAGCLQLAAPMTGRRRLMPTQATNLFLLEDLEDVHRTDELAQSDLDALRSVADWIKTFVVRPHKDLGRAGVVCPFVPGALDCQTLWLAPERIADRDVPEVVELISGYKRLFLDAEPNGGEDADHKVIVVVFTDLPADRAKALFDDVVQHLAVPSYAEDGILFGPFYEGNEGTAIYNSCFRPFQSPVPFVFVRNGVILDWKFFLDNEDWLNLWARRYGESGAQVLAEELRRLPWGVKHD